MGNAELSNFLFICCMYKVIIVDDELRARTLLKGLLNTYCSDMEVVDLCEDVPSAVKSIRQHQPDLVLLDIEMPGYSGLEIVDFFGLNEIDFAIIFTTAYNQYALEAIRIAALDYLLKPIEPAELERSMERFRKSLAGKRPDVSKIARLNTEKADRIGVPTSNGYRFVAVNDIMYLKAEGSYTTLVLTGDEQLLMCRILKNFEEMLAQYPQFYRTHKSFIINSNNVKEFTRANGGCVIMSNGYEIPITSEKQTELFEKMLLIKR